MVHLVWDRLVVRGLGALDELLWRVGFLVVWLRDGHRVVRMRGVEDGLRLGRACLVEGRRLGGVLWRVVVEEGIVGGEAMRGDGRRMVGMGVGLLMEAMGVGLLMVGMEVGLLMVVV